MVSLSSCVIISDPVLYILSVLDIISDEQIK